MHVRPRAAALKIAIGKAKAGERAAEADLAGAVKIEAGLERKAAHRGAIAVAVGPQRTGRQHHKALRSAAADPDIAGDRTVGVDAAVATGAIETAIGEMLAGDKAQRLVGAHLLGLSGHRTQQASQHQCRTLNFEQHPPLHSLRPIRAVNAPVTKTEHDYA